MGNSNAKILRKKLASKIEDELFTINTEIENLKSLEISAENLKKLKRLNYDDLVRLRGNIQSISHTVDRAKRTLNNISRVDYWDDVIEKTEEDEDELNTLIVDKNTIKKLEHKTD